MQVIGDTFSPYVEGSLEVPSGERAVFQVWLNACYQTQIHMYVDVIGSRKFIASLDAEYTIIGMCTDSVCNQNQRHPVAHCEIQHLNEVM